MTLGPGGGAVVDFNFFGDARDLDAMVACARAGAAINRELARRGLDLEAVSDLGDAALAARVRAGAQSAHGAFGTCRVGDVLDDRLRVRGVEALRVVDASAMPTGPCSAPMATVYALAEKAAALIIEDSGGDAPEWGDHVFRGAAPWRALVLAYFVATAVAFLALAVRGWLFSRREAEAVHRALVEPPALGERVAAPAPSSRTTAPSASTPRRAASPTARLLSALERRMPSFRSRSSRVRAVIGTDALEQLRAVAGLDIRWSDVSYAPERDAPRLVEGASGAVRAGEVAFLCGPSGAGKTTLLRVLAQRHTAGVVGGDVAYAAPRMGARASGAGAEGFVRGATAFVPQGLTATARHLEDLTVLETGLFHLALRNSAADQVAALTPLVGWLRFLGLADRAGVRARDLSGGQSKRLQILTRLVASPLAIFLDEPTSGLDSDSAKKLVEVLAALAHSTGVTVVLTIHSPTAAMLALADALVVVAAGRRAYSGPPAALGAHVRRAVGGEPWRRAAAGAAGDGGGAADDDAARILEWLMEELAPGARSPHRGRLVAGLAADGPSSGPAPPPPPAGAAVDRLRRGRGGGAAAALVYRRTWILMAEFLCFMAARWRAAVHGPRLAARFSFGLAMTGILVFVWSVAPDLLPLDELWELSAIVGMLLAVSGIVLSLPQVTVTIVMAEAELAMFEALRLDDLIGTASIVSFWLLRQVPLILSTVPGWLVLYLGVGMQREHALDATLLWLLYVSALMASAHLVQAACRAAGAPACYGLWAIINALFCAFIIPRREVPPWWAWIADKTISAFFFPTLLAIDQHGRPVKIGEPGYRFVIDQIEFWHVSLAEAYASLFVYVVVQWLLVALVIAAKTPRVRPTTTPDRGEPGKPSLRPEYDRGPTPDNHPQRQPQPL